MDPRLKGSQKWTPIPKELVLQIRSVFQQSFKAELGNGTIEAEGRIYPEEILIRVSLRRDKQLKQSGFMVSMAYNQKKDNVLKLLHLAIDAHASLFEQLFASADDHEFPRAWEEVDFENRKIYIQYSTVNSSLEAEADRLLGEAAERGLTQGEWEEGDAPEDVDGIKKKLGLDDED